jgi:hypothetical protein
MFKAGHEAERQVWTKGWVSGQGQRAAELVVSRRLRIVGHLDSWWEGEIYEIKSQSEDQWKPIEESPLWPRYAWQISVYMLAMDAPLTVMRVLRDKDGNVSDSAEERFETPPHSMAEIRQRVFEVEGLARRELDAVECERVEFPCPFFYLHTAKDDRERIEDDGAVALALNYKAAQVEKIAIDGRVKAARAALLEFMGAKKKVDVNGWKLTRFTVPAKHVEYDRSEYEVLRVTEPKVGVDAEAGETDL